MAINTELLNKICTTPGAPGFEQRVRELVIREVKEYVDEVDQAAGKRKRERRHGH